MVKQQIYIWEVENLTATKLTIIRQQVEQDASYIVQGELKAENFKGISVEFMEEDMSSDFSSYNTHTILHHQSVADKNRSCDFIISFNKDVP